MMTAQVAPQPQQASFPGSRFLVNHEFRFLYCPIPKNASSSLKALCLLLEKRHDHKQVLQPGRLHPYTNRHLTLSAYNPAEAQAILNDTRYFKFCFVRNPWSRLTSTYLSKFLGTVPSPSTAQEIKNAYRQNELPPDLKKSITFRQFLGYLATVNHDDDLDFHWRPQYRFLHEFQFQLIGRIETLTKDYQAIKQILQLPLDLPRRNQTAYSATFDPAQPWADLYPAELRSCSALPPYQKFYTPDLVDLVRQRYQVDIERFGYEFDETSG